MKHELLSLILATAAAPALAQEATLKVGDPAPALDVEHWIKGDPVSAFEPGQCYVVEFWATWCPPCKDSMPHLSELQDELGEQIVIIGLSDEPLEVAKAFLDKPEWAAKTRYTLGTDPDRSVYADYMDAAKQLGIPTSFLVDGEGKIAWIGHPVGMDRPLREMLGLEVGEDAGPGMEMDPAILEMMNQEWSSTPAAKVWLDKADAALAAPGWRWDFEQGTTVKMGTPGGEMEELPITRTGSVERAGEQGTRIDAVQAMEIPMMPEPMEQQATVVLRDGVWYMEADPMMPMEPRELKSMTAAEGEALAEEFGAMMATPPAIAPFFDPHPRHADPAATLSAIHELCALDLAEEGEAVVVLRGEGSPMLGAGNPEGGMPAPTTVELRLDRATGRPLTLVIGDAEEPDFQMDFSNFAELGELDPARYELNPEGKELPNLADSIREQLEMMRAMAPGGGGGDDDEF